MTYVPGFESAPQPRRPSLGRGAGFHRLSDLIPVGDSHAVVPDQFPFQAICGKPLRHVEKGHVWSPDLLAACRECRDVTRKGDSEQKPDTA